MPSPLQLALAAARLASASIEVSHRAADLEVAATYHFASPPDSVAFVMIRLPGTPAPVFARGDLAIHETAGLWRLVARPDSLGVVRLRYTVAVAGRLPLAVPTIPTGGSERSIVIRLDQSDTFALAESFPRFEPTGDGSAARLANVPSLLQLPLGGAPPWLHRLERGVLVLLAAASALWLVARRARSLP